MLGLCLSGSAFAQNTSAQEKKKAKLEKEIEILNRQLNENSKKSKTALKDLSLVRSKVNARKKLVKESQAQVNELTGQIDDKQHKIDSLGSRLDLLSANYASLLRATYKVRDTRLWYVCLLASKNFPQASRRYAYLRGLSADMNGIATEMISLKDTLNREKEEIEILREDAEKVRAEHEQNLKKLKKDEKASAAVVNKLNKDKKTYQKQLADKEKQVKALNREIQRLIAEAQKKKNAAKSSTSGKKTVSSSVDAKLSGEFAANKGKLPWPVNGSVIEGFGQHDHPLYAGVKLPFNNGVTIAVNPGAQAMAVYEGTVQQIVVMPGYNQCVLVQHGDYYTFYCKLKSVAVKTGQKVTTGQVVGTVDTIGGETQMHFELWKETTPQNPENWLK